MTRIPASIRHNNPGAMNVASSGWQRRYGQTTGEVLNDGIKHQVNKIATFRTKVGGGAAQFHLLYRFAGARGKRLDKVIATWSGKNSVPSYLQIIRRDVGLTGEHVLTRDQVADPGFAIPLARAMAWHEAGQDFPMSDQEWSEAHAWAMAELGSPSERSAFQIARESRTVKGGSAGAVIATGIAAVGELNPATPVEAVKEAGKVATEIKAPLSAVDALWNTFLANPSQIALIILVCTVGYMAYRRIWDSKEGRHV